MVDRYVDIRTNKQRERWGGGGGETAKVGGRE